MADAKGFLENVLPWTLGGDASVHWQKIGTKKFHSHPCQTVDEMLIVVEGLRSTEYEIYFCLSKHVGRRSRANATGLNCVWGDIDVKSGVAGKYQSIAEALAAVFRFCVKNVLPPPSYIVASGGGLHVYWISDRPLLVEEWQFFADALKAAAIESDLWIDAGVTGDAARVLRVPGTFNYKYDDGPRPVRLLTKYCPGTRYNFDAIFKKTGMSPEGLKAIQGLKVSPAFAHIKPRNIAEGIELHELPPIPFAAIKDECAWLREAYDTGGEKFDNPQWNLTTLVATFLEDGHDLAHRFGNKHPDYLYAKTDEQWERKNRERRSSNIGWPSCRTIQTNGSTHCASCPHLAEGKSPLNLGLAAARDADNQEELQALGGIAPPDLRLPEGYVTNQEGLICYFVPSKTVKGQVQQGRLINIIRNKLSKPSLQYQGPQMGLGFTAATDRDGTIEVFLSAINCSNVSLLIAHLASKGILVNHGKDVPLIQFTSSWLDKLRKEDIATRNAGTMGWRYEGGFRTGFVYGNVLHCENGDTTPITAFGDDEFRGWYVPVGNREAWLKAAKLLTDRKRPELDAIIAIAFAAPLMAFSGTLYGGVLSVWGDPGTAKSTAQQVAAAVWGHPKQTRESLTSTAKSVQGRLGRTKNLPAYWDDIQDERHQEALFQTLFVATEGAEGGRLNTDATMKARLDWQTMLAACSNASFVEFLIKRQKSTTAGMRRVFEIEYFKRSDEPGMINSIDAGQVFGALEHNYGAIGFEYAGILAREHNDIAAAVSTITRRFREAVNGAGDESYWWGMCGVLVAGAMLANRLGAELDVHALNRFLQKAFLHNRRIRGQEGTEGGTLDNTERGLTSFLNYYVGNGNVLFVSRMYRNGVKMHELRNTRKEVPIYVQVARDERKVVISKKAFRDFLQKDGVHVRQVFDGLAKWFKAKEVKLTLGAGTVHAVAQELCLEIPVAFDEGRKSVLHDLIVAHGPPVTSEA